MNGAPDLLGGSKYGPLAWEFNLPKVGEIRGEPSEVAELAFPGFGRSGFAFTHAFGRAEPTHRFRDEWGTRHPVWVDVWATRPTRRFTLFTTTSVVCTRPFGHLRRWKRDLHTSVGY
jgi:hypothetical protein